MVLIVSEQLDASTNHVINWLLKFKTNIIRVNKYDLKIESINYSKNEILFKYNDELFLSTKKITSFWYRRGHIGFDYNLDLESKNSDLQDLIFYHLNAEWEELIRCFTNNLEINSEIKSIGNYRVKDKKLDQLFLAKNAGLNIPKTLITTQKEDLLHFFKQCNKKVITKGISKSPSLTFKNQSLEGYTEEITEALIDSLPDTFFPGFFQENIIKQYELRIFFLKNSFYSMAIFSQNDEQTKTDVRKYNDAKPNRTVPYILPKTVEDKLLRLMNNLNLDTGSIDMIVDKNDEFYFLEVNPNGQFGMVSTPCNYYIEKHIAEILA